jgi:predicted nucleic acid-binding protein
LSLRYEAPREVIAVASVALALEYEAVCKRPEHQIASGLTRREVSLFIDAVIAMMEPMRSHYLWRPRLRDPNDEMVLETAINGHPSILATFNVKDFLPAKRFGVEVLRPHYVLKRLVQ